MSKQLLTLGIVLSFGTVGCAGFGLQQGSNLTAQVPREQGLDNLWSSTEEAANQALEVPLYAEQGLGSLWKRVEAAPTSAAGAGFYQTRSLGNLWTSAALQSRVAAQ